MTSNKPAKSIPVVSKIPTSGRDSGTHSRSSSVSNLTTASDIHSEAGDAASETTMNFKINDRVWVNGTKPGCVKFLGKTQFAPGLWAGVHLDEPAGKNDGSVNGVKYFSCPPLRGIFARPQKLSKSSGGITETGDTPTPNVPATPRNPGFATPTSRGLTTSNLSLSSTKGVCSRLRVGERVVVSSTTGDKSGILKFLGVTDFAKGEWAGIALDEPVGKNDGSVAGKRYFACPMKYGLFAPLHKVSRAGGTSTPKPPSVRGTPLMRSTSRDSLSSSVSTSSKASRVKLGVTSLTNSQQKARSTGVGLMTTSRALEEVLKEKELHIEQLLKEHDLERTEFAKVVSQCEEAVTKYNDLLKQHQLYENEKRDTEQQLSTEKRKIEDLQFQLEEEKITRGDLEMQFQHQTQVLSRIENFLNENLDPKYTNIKEIIDGKENLSKIPEEQNADPQITLLKEKIRSLESDLLQEKESKNKYMQELEDVKNLLNESNEKHESLLSTLNTTNQEQDDIMINLKAELNIQLEKVTKLITENKNLNEQMALQSTEIKGYNDNMKELGEKLKLVSDELNSKVNLLKEKEISIQEKDSKISSLDENLKSQIQQIAELQDHNHILNQDLKQKSSELNEKFKLEKSLEEKLANVKLQLESDIAEKEKKLLDFVKQIEETTSSLQEKEDELLKTQGELSNLQKKIEDLAEVNSQLQLKIKEFEENITISNKDSSEKIILLEKKIQVLIEKKENISKNFEEERKTKQSDFDGLAQELEAKKLSLSEKDTQISSLAETIKENNSEITNMKDELAVVKQTCEILSKENSTYVNAVKEKEELLLVSEKQLSVSKTAVENANEELNDLKLKTDSLQNILNQKEEEIVQLNSKLSLAEKDIEILNQDSTQHVTVLQNELCQMREESSKLKSSLEQKIAEFQQENEKLSTEINEKNIMIKEKEDLLSSSESQLKVKENEISNLSNLIEKLKDESAAFAQEKIEIQALHNKETQIQKENFESQLEKKDKLLSEKEMQFMEVKKETDKLNEELTKMKKEADSLHNVLNQKEEEFSQLNSKLQLAEKNVEMLNRDSSEHVTTLQTELSKLKEESVKTKSLLEQKISELQKEKENLCNDISEKNISLGEKQESLLILESQIKSKDTDVVGLSKEIEELKKSAVVLVKEKEDLQALIKKNSLAHKEEFDSEVKKKNQQLLEIREENEKLSKSISEKDSELDEKHQSLLSLQNQLKSKVEEISEKCNEIEKLKQGLSEEVKNKEELKILHEKQLISNRENFEMELKNKEKIIEETQDKFSEYVKFLEAKEKELQQKENDISSLKNIIKEKESQFDELGQMIQASQTQLMALNEQNATNVKLLESKESFINDFKSEKEKKILELEENLKKENTRLQDVLQKYESDIQQKQEIISKLNTEAEEQKKHLEILNGELIKSRSIIEQTNQNTSEVHQDLISKIADLETKYSQLLHEKKKVEEEEIKAQGAKKNLEEVRDNLLQEKVQREEVVKDKENKLAALQAEVNRMQSEFAQHRQELQEKLDVSKMELTAALELKSELDLQHSVIEEIQEELQNSENRCKQLETQIQNSSSLSSENTELLNKLSKLEKSDKEKSGKIVELGEKHQTLQEMLKNTQNSLAEKEVECTSLNEKVLNLTSQIESKDNVNTSMTSLEQENILLKHKIEKLESSGKKNANESAVTNAGEAFAEERESLLSQIDFLNSIIVDMKQKNENLQQEVELLKMGPEVMDPNFNDTPKKLAPRLFCDICDMFDLHDTDDCPKQESYIEDEAVPHLLPQGARKLEERPYCSNCEVFGHWTHECEEETY